MKGIWRVLNLTNFESHGLLTSQNGYRHTVLNVSLLAVVSTLGTAKCLVALAGTFLVLCVSLFVLFSGVQSL